ncbi:MAG: T9SS type A sorting domain-containing protein [Fibrobacteres bacterium]|nr:T9SS type A sorting domain-containing protein [Fibrobacterota bacterium]
MVNAVFIMMLAFSFVVAWNPEPVTGTLDLPVNVWTKIAEIPADPYGREAEPGQGAYMCYFPDSSKFYRYGGYSPTESNDLYSFSLIQRKWSMLKAPDYSWPSPTNRPGAGPWWSMAYDSKRKVIWMFGGSGTAAQYNNGLYSDMWKFDPATNEFTKMNSTGCPIGNQTPIVYDSTNDRIVRAPAYDGSWDYMTNRDATKIYNPNTNAWESKSTPGSPKSASFAAPFVHATHFGLTVYMVRDTHSVAKDSLNCEKAETWTYNYATNTWTKLNSTLNPPMRVGAAVVYDPVSHLIVIHGGTGGVKGTYGYAYRGGGAVLEDTWTLDLSTGQWTPLSNVGKPVIPLLKGSPTTNLTPFYPGAKNGRLVFIQASDFDVSNRTLVVSSPAYGVWALRFQPAGSPVMSSLSLPALPPLPAVTPTDSVFKKYPPNQKLLTLQYNKWVKLAGKSIGGDEIPLKYDPTSGYLVKFGGCGNSGTTFASGYGNDLVAYDPAIERWFAIRPTDPCGSPRPENGCTRYYIGDPDNSCIWFASGTAGNYLAATIPIDWTGGVGMWKYVPFKDKFEYVSSPTYGVAYGVSCGLDPVTKKALFLPNYSNNLRTFSTTDLSWVLSTTTNPFTAATTPVRYTYGDFIDSLGVLAMIDKAALKFRTVNSAGVWDTLPYPVGYALNANTRATIAYDPFNNVILAVGDGKTYAYTVRTRTWTLMQLDSATPGMGEHFAFDRRHKVFIGSSKGQPTYAFRYSSEPGVVTEVNSKSPIAFSLNVMPNPFVSEISLKYSLVKDGLVSIALYDLKGRIVKTLDHSEKKSGVYNVSWDGRDREGVILPSGIYFAKIVSGNTALTRRIIKTR